MILAIYSLYHGPYTKTVGIYFDDWKDEFPKEIKIKLTTYKKAEKNTKEIYYKELLSLRDFLSNQDMSNIETIIVLDGVLRGITKINEDEVKITPGLEKQLDDLIPKNVLLIGIVKCKRNIINRALSFPQAWKYNTCFINRGKFSFSPLTMQWGNRRDIDYNELLCKILSMKGQFKLPRLLKILESETKRKT